MPVKHVAAEGCPDKAMVTVRVMVEAHLQGNQTFLTQVKSLDMGMLVPIPEVQLVSVLASSYIIQVETVDKCLGGRPFTTHHYIVTWLIPVVIVEVHALG